MLNVRRGTIEEVVKINETITEFDTHFTKEHFQNNLVGKDSLITIGEVDGKLAGFSICWADEMNGWVDRWVLAVNPKYRRLGIMKAMVKFDEAWAKSGGFRRIKCNVNNKYKEMIIATVKQNYSIIGIELHKNIYESRVFFEKKI